MKVKWFQIFGAGAVFLLCLLALPKETMAARKPNQMRISKSMVDMEVEDELTIGSKGAADIRVFIRPGNANRSIEVKSNNNSIVRVKKIRNDLYKLVAEYEGTADITITCTANKKLTRTLRIYVYDYREKPEVEDPEDKKISLRDWKFYQEGEKVDWGITDKDKYIRIPKNIWTLRIDAKVSLPDGTIFRSDTSPEKFSFRSSNDSVFLLDNNLICPESVGDADIVITFTHNGEEVTFDPIPVVIVDDDSLFRIVLNRYKTRMKRGEMDNSIHIIGLKGRYDYFFNWNKDKRISVVGEYGFDHPDPSLAVEVNEDGSLEIYADENAKTGWHKMFIWVYTDDGRAIQSFKVFISE